MTVLLTGALLVSAAASTKPTRIQGHFGKTDRWDGGACSELIDVSPRGCVVTLAEDLPDGITAHSIHVDCDQEFRACSQLYRCDCGKARREAGYFPDGGRSPSSLRCSSKRYGEAARCPNMVDLLLEESHGDDAPYVLNPFTPDGGPK